MAQARLLPLIKEVEKEGFVGCESCIRKGRSRQARKVNDARDILNKDKNKQTVEMGQRTILRSEWRESEQWKERIEK